MPQLPLISRDQLRMFLPTEAAVRAYEALQRALQTSPADIEAAMAAAVAAQASADAAQTSANNAASGAATANSSANALKLPQYLALASDSILTNERVFTLDPFSLLGVDSGPGGAFTVSTADRKSVLPADIADSTAAFVNATGLSLTLVANATYVVDGLLTFQSAATTTGIGLCFTLPAGAGISGGYSHNTTATAIEGSYNNASGAVKGNTSGVLTANDNVPITGRWIVTTGVTPGAAQLQFKSEVAASAVTLKAALSVLTAKRLA